MLMHPVYDDAHGLTPHERQALIILAGLCEARVLRHPLAARHGEPAICMAAPTQAGACHRRKDGSAPAYVADLACWTWCIAYRGGIGVHWALREEEEARHWSAVKRGVSRPAAPPRRASSEIAGLFDPSLEGWTGPFYPITPRQIAQAIRNYLVGGAAGWLDILHEYDQLSLPFGMEGAA